MLVAWPHQTRGVNRTLDRLRAGVRRVCVTSPTGGGKCLGRGTPVLMADGSIRAVETIRAGESVMGPDSRPRLVVATASGREMMYRVTPTRGEPYTVNESHVLSLKLTPTRRGGKHEVVNLGVRDYLAATATFRHRAKGWKAAVEFPARPVPIDPYFLGLWLGDGHRNGSIELSKPDPEVVAACQQTAAAWGLKVVTSHANRCPQHRLVRADGKGGRGYPNPLLDAFRDLGLGERKFVPGCYKVNDRETRLSILAGLMDSDGHMQHAGFDWISRDAELGDGVVYLARSLGFAAHLAACTKGIKALGFTGTYYRVHVSGDCSLIPTRIPRKRAAARRQPKDHLLSGIKVEPIGVGDYFGFELDGPDRLFLLGDFTVTHNTRMMRMLARHFLDAGKRVALYTNRKILLEQTSAAFREDGFQHGVQASGWPEGRDAPLQICMFQTVYGRAVKAQRGSLHRADLVLVDEAGRNTGDAAGEIIERHLGDGASVVGFDATPVGLAGFYDELVEAGCNSELRACGALVTARHYGPDEPDLKRIGNPTLTDDISERKQRKLFEQKPALFGRVYDWWKTLNPDARPAILFASGVEESLWFADQFRRRGVRAAHIDGEDCWLDGELFRSDANARSDILGGSADGRIKVVCNRYVLREGVDAPWLYHGIFATVFGSLTPYLQSGGRLLRSHPTLDHVVLQDHGGNWWRYGSLNADRHWHLGETAALVQGRREDRIRDGHDPEPRRCLNCGLIVMGVVCSACGAEFRRRARMRPVVQADGTLKEMVGNVLKPRRTHSEADTLAKWRSVYFASRAVGRTFRAAYSFFAHTHHYWPPRTLPLMPKSEIDWYRLVRDVPKEDLQ